MFTVVLRLMLMLPHRYYWFGEEKGNVNVREEENDDGRIGAYVKTVQ